MFFSVSEYKYCRNSIFISLYYRLRWGKFFYYHIINITGRIVPVINVDNIQIVAQEQQLTSPAMHIKNANGDVYHVALVPIDGGIYDGSETLVYEEGAINACNEVRYYFWYVHKWRSVTMP